MMLWIILTLMCCAAVAALTIPLVRRYETILESRKAGAAVFIDQLNEVERDRASGTISEADADAAKIEIQRRLLATSKVATEINPVSNRWKIVALAASAGLVALLAVNIYALLGRPDLPGTATTAPAVDMAPAPAASADQSAAAGGSGDVDQMINGLAAKLQQNPKDAEGWRMLGWSYFNRQRYQDSADAYGKAMALDPSNLDFKSSYAEALVQAAGGMVIPVAQATFDEVLKQDPKEFRARFYTALAREQAGDLTTALDQWTSLYADAPKDAGWLVDVKTRIEALGKRTGRDVSQIFASAGPAADAGGTAALDAKAQQELISGMIAKLAAKLEANPQDRDGWAMMIRSLKVQGDMAGAQAALDQALKAFENDPSTRSQIAELAQSLGVVPAGDVSASAPQISADQIAAAQALPAPDQQAMITGMVDKLSARLAASPHDADGWMRLIRSRMVLNQPAMAKDALTAALKEFATDAAVTGQINALATELGLTQNQTP